MEDQKAIEKVRYNQEFRTEGDLGVWHLTQREPRKIEGVRQAQVKNRHGVLKWIPWGTVVTTIS